MFGINEKASLGQVLGKLLTFFGDFLESRFELLFHVEHALMRKTRGEIGDTGQVK